MIEQHNSIGEKFFKKGFWLYFFSFIIAPIGYIIKVIISGELTVSEVGILYGIISLITLISAYNDLGVTESLNHFIPEYVTKKRYDKIKSILCFALIAQLLTGISIAAFFFFGADFIAQHYFQTSDASGVLRVFAFFFLGINIFQIISTFFIAIQNTFYNKIIDFIRVVFILLCVLYVLWFGEKSLVQFSYSWIIGLYFGIVFAVTLFVKKYFVKYLASEKIIYEREMIGNIFRYAGMVFLGTQAGVILSQIDMQMIIYILGTQDAGYYTNYLSIVSIPFMIITPIFALLFPVFSEFHSKKEHAKITTIKNTLANILISIGVAFNILFFVFAETLAYILFGEKFITSGSILQFSILFLVFNFLLQINFYILAGIGRVKKRVQIISTGILANFFMNLIFIHLLGVYGAALATAFGWILLWILSEKSLGEKYSLKLNTQLVMRNIILGIILGTLSFIYIVPLFSQFSRVMSLGVFCLFSLFYFSVFITTNTVEIRGFIAQIKKARGKQ